MLDITLPAVAVVGIANLIHFVPQSKTDRDVTPIISNVHVTLEILTDDNVRVTAVATDRYMVGRYITELPSDVVRIEGDDVDGGTSFLLGHDMLKDLKPKRYEPEFRITVEEQGSREHNTGQYLVSLTTIKGAARSTSGLVSGGNYPPVARLIPGAEGSNIEGADLADTYSLNVAYIGRIAKMVDPTLGRVNALDAAWTVTGTKSEHPTKPGPVVWQKSFGPHEYTVLLQPNLIVR